MAAKFTRREFMKCTGLTACIVAAGSLFSGCGGASGYLAGETATVNGVKITMKGYRNIGGLGNNSFIDVVFELENTNAEQVQISKTIGEAIGNIVAKVIDNSGSVDVSSVLAAMTTSNFSVSAASGSAFCADTAKQDGKYVQYIEAGKTAAVDLYVLITSSNWKSMNITYKPPFGSASFLLKQGDIL